MPLSRNLTIALGLCAALSACGDTIGEQALGGAAIGAGAAALTSGSLAQGAAIGAAGNIAYCELNPGKCN
ncbi:MAG: hypothetical protein AAF307_04280 [Pseudomonadota bacterium]